MLMLWWLVGITLGEIICESSHWQHIQRLKITILGANWQLFLGKDCQMFIFFSLHKTKFYWFEMKIKKFLLPIWWYNRGLFPLGNKHFGVFILDGLKEYNWRVKTTDLWEGAEVAGVHLRQAGDVGLHHVLASEDEGVGIGHVGQDLQLLALEVKDLDLSSSERERQIQLENL